MSMKINYFFHVCIMYINMSGELFGGVGVSGVTEILQKYANEIKYFIFHKV